MGKRAGRFKHHKQGNKKVKTEWSKADIPAQNQLFKSYYQLQLQLPQEQFQVFWAIMKQKLPVVFRVNPSCPHYSAFRDKLQDPAFLQSMIDQQEAMSQEKNQFQPKQMPKLQILPWYPGNILHQISTNKQQFKKSKVLSNLHKYLQKAFDAGLIARQQLVSMLPPLFLDIHEDDIVLDMCAAPGSKTSQLLQMIYGQGRSLKKGCVIANDADYSRAQMLIHQINRSGTAGMAVINHPGQFMPQLYSSKINHIKQKFQFDKILCDVPCSGDGATRKIPMKWANWLPRDGFSLHPLQLSILMKSINLLKRGGLIVYSTCSLNPIQDEAVLSALFDKVQQGLELIDINDSFAIKTRRGMFHWQICATETVTQKTIVDGKQVQEKKKAIKVFKSPEDLTHQHQIKPFMFPPSQQVAKKICLHHSMRILPHDQNSGGFFVALLKKHQNFEWKYAPEKTGKQNVSKTQEEKAKEQQQRDQQFLRNNLPEVENVVANQDADKQQDRNEQEDEEEQKPEKVEANQGQMEQQEIVQEKVQKTIKKQESGQNQRQNFRKKGKESLKYENFQPIDQKQFKDIQQFFGLDDSLKKLLYVRYVGNSVQKKVLLVSEGVQKFLQADKQKKIKLVNMGCVAFQKGKQSFSGNECLYRLSQQGIHFILPRMNKRKIKVSLQFFKWMISIHSLTHDKIEDQEVRKQIQAISQGSFCLYIDEVINGHRVVDAMVGQNFRNSLHLMVGKQEVASFNLRYL